MLLKKKFQLTVPLETRGMECHASQREAPVSGRHTGKAQTLTSMGVSVEKAKWGWENSLGLAGLNNSGGL